ncbi:MAG: hypothetical protein IH874_05345 [Candidatus Dadabacteria bacterium]|nr:hypothetical protein [Candidatus Dadabacteria bacterium]
MSIDKGLLMQCRGCMCTILRKTTRAVTQVFDEAFRPTGIKATQFPVLVATALVGPRSPLPVLRRFWAWTTPRSRGI